MVFGSTFSETQRLQRGVAVGLGVDGVGLRLLGFALGDALMLRSGPGPGRPAGARCVAVASALRYALMAAAKSGESTTASASPFLTCLPTETSSRDTGPEKGASTLVA